MVDIKSKRFLQHQENVYNYLKNHYKRGSSFVIKMKDLEKIIPCKTNYTYTRLVMKNLNELNKIKLISKHHILGNTYKVM